MNRIMRRTVAAVGAGVLTAVMLAGCGGSQATVKDGAYEAKQPIPASQAFKQKSIWIVKGDQNIGKDLEFSSILAFDGAGNVTEYVTNSHKLTDLKDKSVDDIIALAKKEDRAIREPKIKSMQADLENSLQNDIDDRKKTLAEANERLEDNTWTDWTGERDDYRETHPEQYQNALDDKQFSESMIEQDERAKQQIPKFVQTFPDMFEYNEPQPVKYTLSIKTDDTGNNTASEQLSYPTTGQEGCEKAFNDWLENGTPYKKTESMGGKELAPIPSAQVYDMWFGGYANLITRVDQGQISFSVDTPKTEGVKVDEE